jgi:hypothetical protein
LHGAGAEPVLVGRYLVAMCEMCSHLRNELFLENGFGVDFSTPDEVEAFLVLSPDPGQNFEAFFKEQVRHWSVWLELLPEWVADDKVDSTAAAALSGFIGALSRVAEEAGTEGFSRAELMCRLMLEPLAAHILARQSLPAWATDEDVVREARRVTSGDLRSDERGAELRLRTSLARRIGRKSALAAESARALRARRFASCGGATESVLRPRRLLGRRSGGRRLGRHRRSPSRGSPGRSSGDEPSAPPPRGSAS